MGEGKPLSLNLIRDLHGILVRNDPDIADPDKGEFRARQNLIGPRGARVEDSHFVPPPPGDPLVKGLHRWEEWIHREDVPLLVRLAIGHYQFEVLRPFVDGNGRIGRLIVMLMILENEELTVPFLTPARMAERYGVTYQAAVYAIRSMMKAGLVEDWTVGSRRVYAANRVLELLR